VRLHRRRGQLLDLDCTSRRGTGQDASQVTSDDATKEFEPLGRERATSSARPTQGPTLDEIKGNELHVISTA
jgi:hypothetical protein